ncbi:MAG TPA: carbohydrate kinase [Candidatus Hydrogenedentes bacterium]|nr:carbohydrate kinase [Candidatus Hydrogenedentota bacterium]
MDKKKFSVVGLGEVLWDLLPDGKLLGGAPANFAYHAKGLGAEAFVVSAVGPDDLGGEILSQLDRSGLETRYIHQDAEHPTGRVTVTLDAAGTPSYVIHTDVAWDFIPQSPALLDLAERTDATCFGTLCQRSPISQHTVRSFLENTPQDSLRVFDINLRQQFYSASIIHNMLTLSNVLKLNDEELPVVAKLLEMDGAETSLMEELVRRYDLRLVALTRGAKGSLLCTREGWSDHPGMSVTVADTVGAGDAFTAALVMGLLENHPLGEINAQANRLAAYVCTQKGAMPPYSG